MSHRPLIVCLIVAGLAGAFVLSLTNHQGKMGLVWDEPPTIDRVDALEEWFANASRSLAGFLAAFEKANLEKGWRFCHEAPDEHPPVAPLLFLISRRFFSSWLGPMESMRLATVILFSIAIGAMFQFVFRRWGILSAIAACGSLLFHPRMLAEAQLFTLDMPMAILWFLAGIVLIRTCESGRRLWLFGLFAGITIMCKATGILLLPCAVIWAILYRPKNVWKIAAWTMLVVPITMCLLHPGILLSPYAAITRWIHGMLDYPQKVPTYFFGEVINFRTTFLPWHNAFTLIGVMSPLGFVIALTVGLFAAIGGYGTRVLGVFSSSRTPRPQTELNLQSRHSTDSSTSYGDLLDHKTVAGWAAINFLLPCILRMFHFMPGHDGLRQLTYIFPWAALLCGYAVFVIGRGERGSINTRMFAGIASCLIVIPAAWTCFKFQPYGLAYYGELIGGPPGAKRAGMESTYYWDPCNEKVLAWMRDNLPPNSQVVIFPPPDVRVFDWYQRWEMFNRTDVQFVNWEKLNRLQANDSQRPRYILFQMRQGLYLGANSNGQNPFVELTKKPPLYELTPSSVGVPLVAIYSWESLSTQ